MDYLLVRIIDNLFDYWLTVFILYEWEWSTRWHVIDWVQYFVWMTDGASYYWLDVWDTSEAGASLYLEIDWLTGRRASESYWQSVSVRVIDRVALSLLVGGSRHRHRAAGTAVEGVSPRACLITCLRRVVSLPLWILKDTNLREWQVLSGSECECGRCGDADWLAPGEQPWGAVVGD